MPEPKKNITEARKNFNAMFDAPGIHPVTVRGQFKGVILSVGEIREKTAKRLENEVQRNPKASIIEMIDMANKNK